MWSRSEGKRAKISIFTSSTTDTTHVEIFRTTKREKLRSEQKIEPNKPNLAKFVHERLTSYTFLLEIFRIQYNVSATCWHEIEMPDSAARKFS